MTFGVRSPVVLLPGGFPRTGPADAGSHPLPRTAARASAATGSSPWPKKWCARMFWFHPAIWWLLGEISLAREQAVDREVVELTQARDEYVDALLAIAGATPQLDLAPAPLFLRKRHLKQRVVSILKEVRMSKTRLISALAAGLGILAAACWFVTATFPLAAAPQMVNDAPGVTVDAGGAASCTARRVRLSRGCARASGIQGTVTVEATLDGSGNVSRCPRVQRARRNCAGRRSNPFCNGTSSRRWPAPRGR